MPRTPGLGIGLDSPYLISSGYGPGDAAIEVCEVIDHYTGVPMG